MNRQTQSKASCNDLPKFTAFQSERSAQAVVTIDYFLQGGPE
jgi:hypothetical protein